MMNKEKPYGGTIYWDSSSKGSFHGRHVRFNCYCADIVICGKRHRKRSRDYNKLIAWLHEKTEYREWLRMKTTKETGKNTIENLFDILGINKAQRIIISCNCRIPILSDSEQLDILKVLLHQNLLNAQKLNFKNFAYSLSEQAILACNKNPSLKTILKGVFNAERC